MKQEASSHKLRPTKRDLPLAVGLAAFLAVADFLFWGGAFMSVGSHPYSSEEVIAGFTIPCFLAVGITLFAAMGRAAGREGDASRTDLWAAALETGALLASLLALSALLASPDPVLPLLSATAVVSGLGLGLSFVSWGAALRGRADAQLAIVVGGACLLFPAISVALAFLPTLSSYLAVGALACLAALPALAGAADGGPRPANPAPAESASRPAAHDEPPGTRTTPASAALRAAWKSYATTVWSFAALGFVAGFSRTTSLGSGADSLVILLGSPMFILIAGVSTLALWRRRGRLMTPLRFFQAAFPFAVTGFLLFSLTGVDSGTAFACFGHFFFEVMLVVVTLHCASGGSAANHQGLLCYCLALGSSCVMACLGTAVGLAAQHWWHGDIPLFTIGVVLCIYVLSMALALQFKDRPGKASEAPRGNGGTGVPANPEARNPEDAIARAIGAWVQSAARNYNLTPREQEILALTLRGSDTPSIADHLGLSDNTVRTHKKRLYRKLQVHSKQQIIELMRSNDTERRG